MPPRQVILLITHLDPGGAQETVILLADGLRAHGFDAAIAARPGGAEEDRVRAAGVPLLDVPDLHREISPTRDLRAYRQIARILRTRPVDVVHTHSSKAGVLGRLAARRAGIPAVVHTSHGLPVNPDMSRVERTVLLAAERWAARRCDSVVAVSRATAAEVATLRIAREHQVAVIPSGVDLTLTRRAPSKAEARKALGVDSDGPVAGWVGRHFDQKRPEDVVRAARAIVASVPSATVLMVGDGPLMDETIASVADEPRIRVLGYRRDIDTVYAALDVMFLASAWEGLPRTVLEAQAAGVPVVSTDVSGIPEVVRHGETGYLVKPGDWQGLAEGVLKLLRDPAHLDAARAAAVRAVGESFSSDAMVEATARLYAELLSRPRSSPRR